MPETLLLQRIREALQDYPELMEQIPEEWVCELPELVICGSGHIARAVAELAYQLDFRISVFDEQQETLLPERFPPETRFLYGKPENLGEMLPESFFGVVTLGHDGNTRRCVAELLAKAPVYLGALCSSKLSHVLTTHLLEDGFSQEQVDSLHVPIGLKIHGVTPKEIAVSILAELISEKNTKMPRNALSRELLSCREHGCLCVLVSHEGHAPRDDGSMMFVTADRVIDSIGGSTMERATIEIARTCHIPTLRTDCYGARKFTILYIPM